MAFNPATAKPTESSGFNPATAKPIDSGDKIKELSNVEMMMQRYGVPLLKGAQAIGGFFPTSPLSTGATEAGIKAIQGAKPMEALESGGKAGLADAAMMAATLGASKIPGVKGLVKKGASAAGEFLTGIPKDAYMRALNNPSLLKGKFNQKEEFAALGKKFSKSVQALEDKLGGKVGNAREDALKSEKPTVSRLGNLAEQQESKYFPEGRVPAVTKGEAGKLKEIGSSVSPKVEVKESKLLDSFGKPIKTETKITPTIADKQRAILALDGQINWDGTGDTATNLLKQQRNLLNDELRKEAKGVAIANDEYAGMMELKQMIGAQGLKEGNVETLVRNLMGKTQEKQEAIAQLGKMAGTDIGERQKDIWARDFFEGIMPSKGYTSGGNQGVGNLFRGVAIGATPTIPLKAALGASFSPLMHKYALKYGGKGLGAARTQAASAIGGNQ
jgi:hypothetical protein